MRPALPLRLALRLKQLGIAAALVLATILAVRAWDAWRAPPLSLWHREVPPELDAAQIDESSWEAWLAAEAAAMDHVRARVTDELPPEERVTANRYFAASPMNPAQHSLDWNRTQVLMPDGAPRGAVVLLHGLTDAPYSLRHIAARYRERGFVAVSMRMPGHGTVPAGLSRVRWEDWLAATRLAVRHARALSGDGNPLHVVGYSNGGALALKYSLDALEDSALPRPDRLVLISPMIGITSVARFAGVLGWPAVFPPFAKAAWLDVLPEYNPYKYNSFPVNGARQSSQLVRAVESALDEAVNSGRIAGMPPVLTFQSVLDATVSARAPFDTLYSRLPANGSAIVLFDRNRSAEAGLLIRPANANLAEVIVPSEPRKYAVTVVRDGEAGYGVAETLTAASNETGRETLGTGYPPELYSLSHVALPFPCSDPLYGSAPDAGESPGVHLGTVAVRGERGALVVSNDTLMRATCNPFFDYLVERIDATIM